MTLTLILALLTFGFILGFFAGGSHRTIRLGEHYPSLIDEPGAIELSFVSRDAGRTWRLNSGEALPASPLTDKLQDVITNVELGLAVGADREEREAAREADRQGWARKFVCHGAP